MTIRKSHFGVLALMILLLGAIMPKVQAQGVDEDASAIEDAEDRDPAASQPRRTRRPRRPRPVVPRPIENPKPHPLEVPIEAPGQRKSIWDMTFKGGLNLTSHSDTIGDHWEQQIFESPIVVFGGGMRFPWSWRQLYGKVGIELAYSVTTEEISSSSNTSTLTTTKLTLGPTIGMGWEPRALANGAIGFFGFLGVPALEDRKGTIESNGFSQDLEGGPKDLDEFVNFGGHVYYNLGRFSLLLGWEYRVSHSIVGGVTYGF